jgi:hypothetical protein
LYHRGSVALPAFFTRAVSATGWMQKFTCARGIL